MNDRRFAGARRLLVVVASTVALLSIAAPGQAAVAATAPPVVSIDPALHFSPGKAYDAYGDGDTTYLAFVKWHMTSASGICNVSGVATGLYGDRLAFAGDRYQTTYALEYSAYGRRSTSVSIKVTDCAGRSTTASRLVSPGILTDDPAAVYTGPWTTGLCYHPGCWINSTVHKSSQPGAGALFTVTGSSFALITDNRGSFDVYYDGKLASHVVAGQSSVSNGYLSWTKYCMTKAQHTIKVVTVAGRVDVDGVLVS
ncbi:MAG: hypothetical protein WCB04_12170 [Mycobacteriales bacterium]